jgi:3-oxoadipate enol-lactonase
VAILTRDGATIAYSDEGEGLPAFVFIHGFACDRTFWQPQVDDLKRDHRVIAVDLRARGESPPVPPFDTATQAEDVAAVIDAAGAAPAIVVGHSMGGIVALLLNGRRPDLVLGLVLGDSPVTASTGERWGVMASSIRDSSAMEPARAMVEHFFIESSPPAVRERVTATMLGCPPDVAAGMLENAEALKGDMPRLLKLADQKPLMVIWGETPLGDPEFVREATVFARQELIPGAGHFFQLEQPAVTNALLRAFVDDVERDPRLQGSR